MRTIDVVMIDMMTEVVVIVVEETMGEEVEEDIEEMTETIVAPVHPLALIEEIVIDMMIIVVLQPEIIIAVDLHQEEEVVAEVPQTVSEENTSLPTTADVGVEVGHVRRDIGEEVVHLPEVVDEVETMIEIILGAVVDEIHPGMMIVVGIMMTGVEE